MARAKWLEEMNEFLDQMEKCADQIKKLNDEIRMYDAVLKSRVAASRAVGTKRCYVADDGLFVFIEDLGKIAKLRKEATKELSTLLVDDAWRYLPFDLTPIPRDRGYGVYLGYAWMFGLMLAFGLAIFRSR